MISFRDVTLRRGPRALFSRASFSLFDGDRVAVVGPNGTGKSSLFALITGELSVDAGDVSVQAGHILAAVAQEIDADARAAVDFVLDGDRELRGVETELAAAEAAQDGVRVGSLHARLEAIGGYSSRARAARLLAGLGFDAPAIERPVAEFSGGWRRRLALAQALMARSDVLLLDEPTNHLDLDAVLWLEDWLRSYPGLLVVIAHDREFLDRVVTRIVSIENGQVETYTGNYSDFETQRADRLSQQHVAFERQQREVKHILDFVARFKAKATKARQAQSRLKMLERMERIAPAHVDSPFEFSFLEPARLPRPLLVLDRAKLGYGERVIIDGASMSISPGDRIGLLGRNGAGKSTLTKALAGTQELLSGRRTTAQDLLVGYFAQHQIELLDAQSSAIEHLKRLGGDSIAKAPEEEQRNFLGGFGFTGDRVFEAVGPFSGGEKARLVLALVVSRRPNLLLLDEPTNHLDLEMRHALGMALQDYTGAIVLVSHDRYLLKLVADELWLVNEGQAAPFDGDLDDYANWLRTAANSSRNSAKIDEAPRSAASEKERKRAEAARRAELAPLRAVITKSEREMTKISPRLSELELLLADPALYEPSARTRLTTLLTEQASLKSNLEAAESAWLSASEAYEAAEHRDI